MNTLDVKRNLKLKYPTEQVFVVPYNETTIIPDKFTPAKKVNRNIDDWTTLGKFIMRYDAEYNSAFQQLIPYILIADKELKHLYVTQRISGEERLQGSFSLGCGGHINPSDYGNVILNCAKREMNEELNINFVNNKLNVFGYVRDLSSSTNDHTGIVFIVLANEVFVKEKDNLTGSWMDYNNLIAKYGYFESWSKHILDYIFMNNGFSFLEKVVMQKWLQELS